MKHLPFLALLAGMTLALFFPSCTPNPGVVSDIDTTPETGSVVIYYIDGQMNAGRDFYKPRIEGSFIIFEADDQY